LLAVEAKKMHNLDSAFPQLVVYLASIRESRLSQGQSDASVYGVASDGYSWIFVTITHDGTLQESRRFDIKANPEDLRTILGCVRYILEKSASVGGPNMAPEGGDPLDLDDGDEYLTASGGDDDSEDEK
jgi:hypothetical protein